MVKSYIVLSSLLFAFSFGQYDFSLGDLNDSSPYFEQNVGPSYFPDQIRLVYFGHFN